MMTSVLFRSEGRIVSHGHLVCHVHGYNGLLSEGLHLKFHVSNVDLFLCWVLFALFISLSYAVMYNILSSIAKK